MPHETIDLSRAGVRNFSRGRNRVVEAIWILIDAMIIDNRANVFSGVRIFLLRLFGAQIGANCRFMHAVRIKFPWKLKIGKNCWIGEGVVFYNHDAVTIGDNVCISQETFITSGSHALSENMDLTLTPIVIQDGVWVCSRCVIQKGVVIGTNAVITPNSVVTKNLAADGIYGGNPCVFIRDRWASSKTQANG